MLAPSTNLTDLIDDFLDSLTNASPRTLVTYRQGLQLFIDAKLPLDTSALAAFDAWLARSSYDCRGRAGRYSASTRYLYVTALRRLLIWLDATDQAPDLNLSKAQSRLHVGRGTRGVLSLIGPPRTADPALPRIVAHYAQATRAELPPRLKLEALRDSAFVWFLFDTGARLGEALALTRVELADGRRCEVEIHGKGNFRRWLFLSPSGQAAICDYCASRADDCPTLFAAHFGRPRPLSRFCAYMIVKQGAQACGLPPSTSPHSFRHWRAVQLLNAGMPLEGVQTFLGHRKIETTRRFYAHTITSRLRDQVGQFRADALPGELPEPFSDPRSSLTLTVP